MGKKILQTDVTKKEQNCSDRSFENVNDTTMLD